MQAKPQTTLNKKREKFEQMKIQEECFHCDIRNGRKFAFLATLFRRLQD